MTRRQSRLSVWLALLVVGAGLVAFIYRAGFSFSPRTARRSAAATVAASAPPTFSRDVAPILFSHCAACHHAGGSGAIELLTAADLRHHAKQVATVIDRGLMPPWMPDGDRGIFIGDRRLTRDQIVTLHGWIDAGMPEGNAADLPAAPQFTVDGWSFGKPDLLLELPQAYTLPAGGKDVYRNFVLPTRLTAGRYVRAVEMRPGGKAVVHHVFLMLDQSTTARRRDGKDGQIGYDGMSPGEDVTNPRGQLLGWQPGRGPCVAPDGAPWRLAPGADVVLAMHLRPSGKPAAIRPAVALYFTDQPPTRPPVNLLLRSTSIDIPAGAADYAIASQYTLPVDVELLAVLPHAHYLGKDLSGYAVLPGGRQVSLIHIPDWDFDWQTDYRFATPLALPRGTVLHMRYTYDNSAANPRNQHQPPQRVTFGNNSTDEMGELWLQVRPATPRDADALTADYVRTYALPESIERINNLLRLQGDSARQADLRAQLATLYLKLGRLRDAAPQLQTALQLNPSCAPARRCLGSILFDQQNYAAACEQFRKAIAADPDDYRSRADLGLSLAILGNLPEAIEQMRASIATNPNDALTHTNLARVLAMQSKSAEALAEINLGEQLNPDDPFVRQIHRELHSSLDKH